MENRKPKFVIFKDVDNEYRFNLTAPNGEVIGSCTQGFKSLQVCNEEIDKVIEVSDSKMCDLTKKNPDDKSGARYEVYLGEDSQYWFRLITSEEDIVLKSEGYTEKHNCKNGIESVKTNAPIAERENTAKEVQKGTVGTSHACWSGL